MLSELEKNPLQPQFPDLNKEVVKLDKLEETKILKSRDSKYPHTHTRVRTHTRTKIKQRFCLGTLIHFYALDKHLLI